ncbi:MAG: FkbM family methyltransferase [Dongiaceae bacterium]
MQHFTRDVSVAPVYRIAALPWPLAFLRWASKIKSKRWKRRILKKLLPFLGQAIPCCWPKAEGVIELYGKPAKFRAANLQFVHQFIDASPYEMESLRVAEILLGVDGVFFDIGSNWGYFAHAIAGNSQFQGQVHAFELEAETFGDLLSLKNQWRHDKLTVHHLAISAGSGEAASENTSWDSGGKRIAAGKGIKRARLDDLNLPAPALTKIDVEGHEAEVLQGAEKLLRAHKPAILIENLYTTKNLKEKFLPLKLLREWGYHFFLPCWQIMAEGMPVFTFDLALAKNGDKATLALVPTRPEDRLLYDNVNLNVVAIHTEKLTNISAIFNK